MKFIQIVAAQWTAPQKEPRGVRELTYTLHALGDDGNVYRYGQTNGWTRLGSPNKVQQMERPEDPF